jgi:DNA repair protein RadD
MRPELRPVQVEWIGEISAAFRAGPRVLAQAPTGFGKTVCFAEMVRRTSERGHTAVVVAHRIEIVRQIGAALERAGVPFGWALPGMPTPDDRIIVGMVQTIANRVERMQRPTLLVIDEAHHATAGSYQRIAKAWAGCFILGVSASPQRTDGRGMGDCFDHLVIGPAVQRLIDDGYLSAFTYLAPPKKIDLSSVRVRAGDYAQEQLAAAMDTPGVTGDAVEHYAKHLAGRPAIAFCVSVEHAKHVAEQFAAAGWLADSVDGSTDPDVRADRIAAIGDGRLNVLSSCDIISEGTDIPVVAGAILLRPTKSLIVYLQQVGRVLRPKPDKSRAIILDHVGNVFEHGLPTQPREWTLQGRTKREAAPPVKQCMQCYACHAPAPSCPSCGHVYAVAAKPRVLAHRAGDLAEVTEVKREPVKREDLSRMLRSAKTLGEVLSVAKYLGYSSKWAIMEHKRREKYRRSASA